MTIYFYSNSGTTNYLSNFAMYTFYVNGKKYLSNEHYYQSQKFVGNAVEEIIRNCKTAKEAKTLAAIEHALQIPDFDKCEVMYNGLRAKFDQNQDIKQKLIDTGQEMLVENSDKDYYWGCGSDMTGLNMLGRLLMKLREQFREELELNGAEVVVDLAEGGNRLGISTLRFTFAPTIEPATEDVHQRTLEHRVTKDSKL